MWIFIEWSWPCRLTDRHASCESILSVCCDGRPYRLSSADLVLRQFTCTRRLATGSTMLFSVTVITDWLLITDVAIAQCQRSLTQVTQIDCWGGRGSIRESIQSKLLVCCREFWHYSSHHTNGHVTGRTCPHASLTMAFRAFTLLHEGHLACRKYCWSNTKHIHGGWAADPDKPRKWLLAV